MGGWWALITLTSVGYGDLVPNTVMGKLVAGGFCIIAVMIMSIAAAQFSINFREKWIQAKAKTEFRKRFAGNAFMVQEQEEIEALMVDFQNSMDDLVRKASGLAVQVGAGTAPAAMAPLLMSVKEHAVALSGGTYSYIYEVLAEAMLREVRGKEALGYCPKCVD